MDIYHLFENYQQDFMRFALSLTHHREDAEDLVQQVYVKAMMHLELIQTMNPHQVKGWVMQSIKNAFIDQYRKNKRNCDFEKVPELGYDAHLEDQVIVKEMVDALPERLQAVVVLRYIQNYNSSEISSLLGINASTVRSRLSQAMQILRENF